MYTMTERMSNYREDVFSQEGLFSFKGRRNRMTYFLVSILLSFFSLNAFETLVYGWNAGAAAATIIGLAGYVFFFYMDMANTVKRVHDIGWNTSWGVAICLFEALSSITYTWSVGSLDVGAMSTAWMGVFSVSCFISLYLLFKGPQKEDNEYGPNPLTLPRKNPGHGRVRILIGVVMAICAVSLIAGFLQG